MRNLRLEGKYVYLEEVQPKYFPYIIEWRNNPENNKFLNQPFKLTMELQTNWYEEKYLKDKTQGLFIMVDKENNLPFGTIGWTDLDQKEKACIGGRLLVGNWDYKGSIEWREAVYIFNSFIYNKLEVDEMYAHVVTDNIASLKWHNKWGFKRNDNTVKFPKELVVNGMEQIELIRSYGMYLRHISSIQKM